MRVACYPWLSAHPYNLILQQLEWCGGGNRWIIGGGAEDNEACALEQ